MATKPASSAAAAASTPQVSPEVQPTSGAWTIAYTAAAKPAVTVTDPAISMDPFRAGAAGISSGTAISASTAIGMLM